MDGIKASMLRTTATLLIKYCFQRILCTLLLSAMLWTRCTLVAILIGVILCNRFADNRRLIDFSAPYAAAVRNSDAQKVAILESLSNVDFMSNNSPNRHNELMVFNQNNYPYHAINKVNENLQRKNDVYTNLDSHEDVNGKYEQSQDKNNNFEARSDIFSSNQEDAKFGLNDLKLATTYDKSPESQNGGNFWFNGLEDSIVGEGRSLSEIDIDNVSNIYEDLLPDLRPSEDKRGASVSTIGCDCKIKNDLLDLGQRHFPRYLLNAVCQSTDVREPRCWRGICKPLEYKVKVLTFRTVKDQKDPALAWLPDDLRQLWKFKTVTVAAGCFCAVG